MMIWICLVAIVLALAIALCVGVLAMETAAGSGLAGSSLAGEAASLAPAHDFAWNDPWAGPRVFELVEIDPARDVEVRA